MQIETNMCQLTRNIGNGNSIVSNTALLKRICGIKESVQLEYISVATKRETRSDHRAAHENPYCDAKPGREGHNSAIYGNLWKIKLMLTKKPKIHYVVCVHCFIL